MDARGVHPQLDRHHAGPATAVIVTIGTEHGTQVTLDTDDQRGYTPDVADDMCTLAVKTYKRLLEVEAAHEQADE